MGIQDLTRKTFVSPHKKKQIPKRKKKKKIRKRKKKRSIMFEMSIKQIRIKFGNFGKTE